VSYFLHHTLPYLIAGAGIASTLFLMFWVVHDLVAERGRGSLRSNSPALSLDDELDAIQWEFPRTRLPR
jgi:hypothetical protein